MVCVAWYKYKSYFSGIYILLLKRNITCFCLFVLRYFIYFFLLCYLPFYSSIFIFIEIFYETLLNELTFTPWAIQRLPYSKSKIGFHYSHRCSWKKHSKLIYLMPRFDQYHQSLFICPINKYKKKIEKIPPPFPLWTM